MTDLSYIDRNVEAVTERIRRAAEAVGRKSEDITLLAAVKYATDEEIAHLGSCGIRVIGENRVQQFREHSLSESYAGYRKHFIGSLQTNKVKYIVPSIDMIESLDSIRLAEEIERQASKCNKICDVLCEINIGREENKSGVLPEEIDSFFEQVQCFEHLMIRGFMTMAPATCTSDEYRRYFAQTYRLACDVWQKNIKTNKDNSERPIISMGMSGSFEEAVLEGSDVVRVGRGLFQK